MKLVAIGMVKDEADVIERTLWHVAVPGSSSTFNGGSIHGQFRLCKLPVEAGDFYELVASSEQYHFDGERFTRGVPA